METKYYDTKNKRLVFIGSHADDNYRDKHWQQDDFRNSIQKTFDPFVVGNTKKYIKKGGKILEGGCGIGQNVYLLNHHGFNTIGIDYAEKTIEKINVHAPELDVRFGDVRRLPFENDSFDGYWSFGVIEHFYDGYDEIMSEMHRVINKGGVLLMTVPSMSILRKLKAKQGRYPLWDEDKDKIKQFYQYALDHTTVINNFENNGFRLMAVKPYDGFKGLKDEVIFLKKPMQYMYDSKFILVRIVRKIVSKIIERFSNHMTLFIFKKI